MTDDLVVVCLIFIFCDKICRAGKCDLVNVFLHLIRSHADTVIDKLDGLCDPESEGSNRYPIMKTVNFGVNIKF